MLINVTLATISYALIWNWPDVVGSTRVIATGVVMAISAFWLLIWFFLQSRIPKRSKWITTGAIGVLLLLAVCLLRVRAFTGDFLPILAWRWTFESPPLQRPDSETMLPEGSIELDPTLYDSPGFLGPQRTGSIKNIGLSTDWSTRPPKLLWHKSIGDDAGFSSFAVVGNMAVTQQQERNLELVICYHLLTGNILWVHADPARFIAVIPMGGVGPRATPTIHEGRVYAIGATGILNCLDLKSGEKLWAHNVPEENDAAVPQYGVAASPLIVDDMVVVTTGSRQGSSFSTLVSYHQQSGELVWTAGEDDVSYASPTIAVIAGYRQIVSVNEKSVTAHDPATGKQLWRYPRPTMSSTTSQPVAVSDDRILVSKGYGNGARLWKVSKNSDEQWSVIELWHNRTILRTKATSALVRDAYAYGLNDGILECVEVTTGDRQWKVRGDYGHGQVILLDDLLLIQAESGDVALVEAKPGQHREVARFSPLSSRTWNYPVVAGSHLLIRNDREIACYELPVRDQAINQDD